MNNLKSSMKKMMSRYTHVLNPQTQLGQTATGCSVAAAVMRVEVRTIDFWRAVISECLGTFFYVLLGCSSTLICEDIYEYKQHILLVSLCFGFTLATLVQCFGHISGGHFNPMLSLAMTCTTRITPLRGILYCVSQLGGGIAGAAVLYGIAPGTCHHDLGMTSLNKDISPAQGVGIEFLLTFILAFTVYATIDPNRHELGSKPLAIGIAVCLCHLAGYRFTKSSMNPARSLGPAFIMNQWNDHWVYWVGPLAGGLSAGFLYKYIFGPQRKCPSFRRDSTTPPPDRDEDDVVPIPNHSTTELLSPSHRRSTYVPGSFNRSREVIENNYANCNGDVQNQNSQKDTSYGFHGTNRQSMKSYMSVPSQSGLENDGYFSDTGHKRNCGLLSPVRVPPTLPPREEITLNEILVEPIRPMAT